MPSQRLGTTKLNNILYSRRESGEKRNDLIDMMIECMKNQDESKSDGKKQMDEDTLISTAFVMLVAG